MSERTGDINSGLNPDACTAWLWIVIPAAMLRFFYATAQPTIFTKNEKE